MGIDSTEHQAVTRLFELSRTGDTQNCEFGQLDSLIYEGLSRTYKPGEPDPEPVIKVQAAA